jgi:hypothetical protein
MKTSHNYQLSPIYLVLTDGYYSMNINELVFKKYKILITAVTTSKLIKKVKQMILIKNGNFDHRENNVSIFILCLSITNILM